MQDFDVAVRSCFETMTGLAIGDEEFTVQPHDDAPLIDWANYCYEWYQLKGGWKKAFSVDDWVEHLISEGYSDDHTNSEAGDSEMDLR